MPANFGMIDIHLTSCLMPGHRFIETCHWKCSNFVKNPCCKPHPTGASHKDCDVCYWMVQFTEKKITPRFFLFFVFGFFRDPKTCPLDRWFELLILNFQVMIMCQTLITQKSLLRLKTISPEQNALSPFFWIPAPFLISIIWSCSVFALLETNMSPPKKLVGERWVSFRWDIGISCFFCFLKNRVTPPKIRSKRPPKSPPKRNPMNIPCPQLLFWTSGDSW